MITKLATLLLFGLIFLAPQVTQAQDKLYLEYPGKFKRIEIEPGSFLQFKLSEDKHRYSAKFSHAHGEWVHFGKDSLRIKNIEMLFLQRSSHWRGMLQGTLVLIAVAYPVMILLNRTAVNGFDPKDFVEMAAVSGSALGLFGLLSIFSTKKYPLYKDKWRLQTRTPIEDL